MNINDIQVTLDIDIKIKPYWNVNMICVIYTRFTCCIKIKPYWNVNENMDEALKNMKNIKIKPYWNVNFDKVDECILYNVD